MKIQSLAPLLVVVVLTALAPVLIEALDVPSVDDVEQVEVTLTADRGTYEVGEAVELTVTWCNPLDWPVRARLACPCCADDLEILDLDGNVVAELGVGCIQAISSVELPADGCIDSTWSWAQTSGVFEGLGTETGEAVAPGQYTARFTWTTIFDHADRPNYQTETTATVRISAVGIPTLPISGLVALALGLVGAALVVLRRG